MSSHLIGRRQFLAVTSAGAVVAAVAGPRLFAGEAVSSPRRIAVGYAPLAEDAPLGDAASIPAADGGFIGRGARVTVMGVNVASAEPRLRKTVGLIAHYPYLDGAERKTTPFTAWGSGRTSGSTGSASSFTMPVDEIQKLSFTIGAETGAPRGAATRRDALIAEATESTELPLTLSLQNEAGSLKLARGFYVIAPIFGGDSDPRWSAYTMRQLEGRWTLVDRDGTAAPFEHFVLKIDYARES
ncbi:MAG TPA: hypothetical protein VF266_15280 [Thermoanaerobaculia bacterium]